MLSSQLSRAVLHLFLLFMCIGVPLQAASLNSMLTTGQQSTSVEPSDPSAVRELVSHMSDQDVRSLLIERLDLVNQQSTPQQEQQGFLLLLNDSISGVVRSVSTAFRKLPQTIRVTSTLFAKINQSAKPNSIFELLTYSALAVVLGLLVRFAYCRLTLPAHLWLDKITLNSTLYLKATAVLTRLIIAFVSVLVFTHVSIPFVEHYLTASAAVYARVIVEKIFVLSLTAYAFFAVILATEAPQRRLLNIDDWHAKFFLRHITLLAALIGFTGAWFI